MKWHITRKRMLAIIIVLFLTLAAFSIFGCTKRDEEAAKRTGGLVGGLFGLPPVVGESLVATALALSHAITAKLGEKRGRRKERACHVPQAKASA
jgi:hypothetical protein